MDKKTETIEFRIDPNQKQRLIAQSAKAGTSLSEYIRRTLNDLPNQEGQTMKTPSYSMLSTLTPSLPRACLWVGATVLGGALIWGTVTTPPAFAQAEVRAWFAEMDQDFNGTVTFDEFSAGFMRDLESQMEDIAKISNTPNCEQDSRALLEEFNAEKRNAEADILRSFEIHDLDDDGALSYGELQSIHRNNEIESFQEVDLDSNSVITFAEFAPVMEAEIRDEEDYSFSEFEPACAQSLRANIGDDTTSLDEIKAVVRMEFARIDVNMDQQIDQEEFLNF